MPFQGLNPDSYQRGAVPIKNLKKPLPIFPEVIEYFCLLQRERGRYSRVQTQDL
jgi:hypothetical protein